MDRRQFIAGALLASTASLALTRTAVAQAPAAGAIPAPQYFAMASRGGTFLENSARFGLAKTSDPRLRRFAQAEVNEQVRLAQNLNANADFATATVTNPATGALVGAGVGALVGGPVGAAVGAGIGATTATVGGVTIPMTTDAQKAALIAQLQVVPPGPEFDALFVQSQIIGHNEAYAIHGSYAQSGDDPGLRRVARNALPLIRLHLSQLARFQGRAG
jgi:predicted outer membrane protein